MTARKALLRIVFASLALAEGTSFIQPTAYAVLAGYRLELGRLVGTNLQTVLDARSTARRKAAAGRQVNQVGDIARDDIQLVFDFTQDRD